MGSAFPSTFNFLFRNKSNDRTFTMRISKDHLKDLIADVTELENLIDVNKNISISRKRGVGVYGVGVHSLSSEISENIEYINKMLYPLDSRKVFTDIRECYLHDIIAFKKTNTVTLYPQLLLESRIYNKKLDSRVRVLLVDPDTNVPVFFTTIPKSRLEDAYKRTNVSNYTKDYNLSVKIKMDES